MAAGRYKATIETIDTRHLGSALHLIKTARPSEQGGIVLRSLLTVLLILGCATQVQARSKAADYLIKQTIAEACEYDGGSGTIEASAVIERDLTGDGKADLIISHEGITCANNRRSGYCGVQVCTFTIYVRRGALLQLELEMLGGGIQAAGEGIPRIEMYAHGGSQHSIRWNGQAFR